MLRLSLLRRLRPRRFIRAAAAAYGLPLMPMPRRLLLPYAIAALALRFRSCHRLRAARFAYAMPPVYFSADAEMPMLLAAIFSPP